MSSLNTVNGAVALILNGGDVIFSGSVGNSTPPSSLNVQSSGTITVGANQTVAGAITYNGPVTVANGPTLANTGGVTSFLSTIDGASALTFNGGSISFSGAVGGAIPLNSINVQFLARLQWAPIRRWPAR